MNADFFSWPHNTQKNAYLNSLFKDTLYGLYDTAGIILELQWEDDQSLDSWRNESSKTVGKPQLQQTNI